MIKKKGFVRDFSQKVLKKKLFRVQNIYLEFSF